MNKLPHPRTPLSGIWTPICTGRCLHDLAAQENASAIAQVAADYEQEHASSELESTLISLRRANRDMDTLRKHVESLNAEADAAEARRDVANADATQTAQDLLSHQRRLDALEQDLADREYEDDVRAAQLADAAERLDPANVVDDFLSFAQSRLRGVSRMVFDKFRGLVSDWAAGWSKETRDLLDGKADHDTLDFSFFHDFGPGDHNHGDHDGLG